MTQTDLLFKELLETFRMEARDHLGALSTLLVSLENEEDVAQQRRLVETIFRRMHTLKGAAHAVNLADVAKTCQELEDLLAALKRGELELDSTLFDRLHDDVDRLSRRFPGEAAPLPSPPLTGAAGVGRAPGEELNPDVSATKVEARPPRGDAAPLSSAEPEPRPAQPERQGGETVRVSTRLLETLLLQAEELVSAKLAASALAGELAALCADFSAELPAVMRTRDLARESLRKAEAGGSEARVAALLEKSADAQLRAGTRLRALETSAGKQVRTLGGMVDPLLDDIKKLHLLPFSSLTDPFHKLVRDLGRELDKEAELICTGCGIDVDRRILAELKEPLLHLVRNVMDHGIEKGGEREAKGKPRRARISIEVRLQDANLAEVVISDDGRGIDVEKVKSAALGLELATPEALESMSDQEALQYIFESGVSTTHIITTLSGRGVGLAIVRESIEKLGGHVTVASTAGAGSVFRLSLPLSYAMMRALLVGVGGRVCFIPAPNVELAARIAPSEIRSVESRETVVIGGEVIALASLPRLLGLTEQPGEEGGPRPVVLVNAADKRLALSVDHVAEVQEILVKPLGSQLSRVRNVAGATVLGNGQVVPVLNVGDIFRSAQSGAFSGEAPPAPPSASRKRRSVLVVEDSITSRTLLKNILEASGFLVATAVDGVDALAQLRVGEFDVVVSDVEMPRMDGFELTAAIRGDRRLEDLPVILVTGLESRADREKGIDVGANAYVVKSSFDQGGLVEVIGKLT